MIFGALGVSSILRRRFSTCTITVLPEPGRKRSFHTDSYSSAAVTVLPRFFSRY